MGALDPSPGLSCRCLEPFPQQASICPLRLPCSGSTFLLLLTLPPPHAPSCSLRSGFPVAANNVLIHLVAGIWRRGEGLGAEEEEGERQRSECTCPGPAIQLWLRVLCGAVSAPPVSYGNEGCALLWFVHLPCCSTLQTHRQFQPSLLGISILQASHRSVCGHLVALAR